MDDPRPEDSLDRLRTRLAEFASRRDWQRFHSPKNLSMAPIAETAELVCIFNGLMKKDSGKLEARKHTQVSHELADILIYLIRTADQLGIDLIAAADARIRLNEKRYPVEKVRGKALRAEEYD